MGKEQATIYRLETELKDCDEALAKLMQEHVRLKKSLGRSEAFLGDFLRFMRTKSIRIDKCRPLQESNEPYLEVVFELSQRAKLNEKSNA